MRAAIIENLKVSNIVEVDQEMLGQVQGVYMVDGTDLNGKVAQVGDDWDGAYFTTPEPAVNLDRLKADAIAQTYKDVDAVYADAVGNRAPEYALAEEAAIAFRSAGYAGTVSEYVSGYAASNPTGQQQTNQWAADQIIARAEAMRTAQLAMRNTRFEKQADMRAASTREGLSASVSSWNQFIAGVRASIGV